MRLYKCDKCHKDIEGDIYTLSTNCIGASFHMDLCLTCMKSFEAVLNAWKDSKAAGIEKPAAVLTDFDWLGKSDRLYRIETP